MHPRQDPILDAAMEKTQRTLTCFACWLVSTTSCLCVFKKGAEGIRFLHIMDTFLNNSILFVFKYYRVLEVSDRISKTSQNVKMTAKNVAGEFT